ELILPNGRGATVRVGKISSQQGSGESLHHGRGGRSVQLGQHCGEQQRNPWHQQMLGLGLSGQQLLAQRVEARERPGVLLLGAGGVTQRQQNRLPVTNKNHPDRGSNCKNWTTQGTGTSQVQWKAM